MNEARTRVTYATDGDPWPVVEDWAKRHKFRTTDTADARLYERSSALGPLGTPPLRVQLTHAGDEMELVAWVHVPLFTRICALFALPPELPITSRGLGGNVPRRIARNAVNELLAKVGAPRIE